MVRQHLRTNAPARRTPKLSRHLSRISAGEGCLLSHLRRRTFRNRPRRPPIPQHPLNRPQHKPSTRHLPTHRIQPRSHRRRQPHLNRNRRFLHTNHTTTPRYQTNHATKPRLQSAPRDSTHHTPKHEKTCKEFETPARPWRVFFGCFWALGFLRACRLHGRRLALAGVRRSSSAGGGGSAGALGARLWPAPGAYRLHGWPREPGVKCSLLRHLKLLQILPFTR